MTVMNQQNCNTMFLHNGIVLKDSKVKHGIQKWDTGYFYRDLTWEQNWYILMSYSLRVRLNILNLGSGLKKLRRFFPILGREQVCPKQVILEVQMDLQMQRQHFLTNNASFNKLWVSTLDADYKGMHQCFIITNNNNSVISLFFRITYAAAWKNKFINTWYFIIYRMCNKADNYLWVALKK